MGISVCEFRYGVNRYMFRSVSICVLYLRAHLKFYLDAQHSNQGCELYLGWVSDVWGIAWEDNLKTGCSYVYTKMRASWWKNDSDMRFASGAARLCPVLAFAAAQSDRLVKLLVIIFVVQC